MRVARFTRQFMGPWRHLLKFGSALALALGMIVFLSASPGKQVQAAAVPAVLMSASGGIGQNSEGGDQEPEIEIAPKDRTPDLPANLESSKYRIFLGQVRIPAPFPVSDGQAREVQVPVLMYHYISSLPHGADAIRRDLTIEPEVFASHLDRIQEMGYQTVTIRAIVENLQTGAPLPRNPIVLTFDDGYVGQYVHAFPALQHRDMVGTFFIVSDFPYSGNTDYMDWGMVREMARAGMEMESHAQWHKTLANRNETYLTGQIENSMRAFQQELGYRPRIISYPGGLYDSETIRVYRDAGFWAGITTLQGKKHHSNDLFRMRRVRLHGGDKSERVAWLLSPEGDSWQYDTSG